MWKGLRAAAGGMLLGLFCMAAHAHGQEHASHQAAPAGAAVQKAFGKAGDPKRSTRTIRMAMSDDMRFAPNHVTVRQGETVRFVVENKGAMLHEIVIGTPEDLKEHAAMMRQFPEMEHDEPYMAHVSAGKREELVWHFNRPGQFAFACLVAGHFEAGMAGTITVLPASGKQTKDAK